MEIIMFNSVIGKLVASIATVVVAFVALTGSAWAAVEANSADASGLETVKGIGPALSGKILAERKQGAFKDWSDLETRVAGVGEKNAAGFSRAGLTVAGKSKDGAQAGPDAQHPAKSAAKKGGTDGGNPSLAKK